MGGVPLRQHVILCVSPRVDEMQEQLAALAQQRRHGTTVWVPVFTTELLTFDRARLRPVGCNQRNKQHRPAAVHGSRLQVSLSWQPTNDAWFT